MKDLEGAAGLEALFTAGPCNCPCCTRLLPELKAEREKTASLGASLVKLCQERDAGREVPRG